MGYWIWLLEGFINRIISTRFLMMLPFLIGSVMTMYMFTIFSLENLWVLVPMAIGLIITLFLGSYMINWMRNHTRRNKMGNCRICRYYYPKLDRIETKSYCHRNPKKLKVDAYHWCGEFDEQKDRR